jgi:hypothetical protein
MHPKITLSNGVNVELEKTPFASGGEADVYRIISPSNYSHQVLKIYKQDKRTKHKEEKLNFLIKNKPNLSSNNGHHSVVWPIHVAYQNNSFLGYTMPKATGIKLELLCHPKLPKSLSPDWDKFSFNTPGSVDLRMKLCFNIAVALAQVHSIGSYVLVDMKPDNVIIRPDGLISIIDIDSTEILSGNQVLFPAQVATPEYTPPEFYISLKDIEKNLIPETWDRFSLSIIFYRLLLGIHPYTASLKPPYESLTNVSDLIQKGFFPNGRHRDKFRTIPPPHNNFFRISKQIQHLFLSTFEESHSNVTIRPSADDWCKVLSPEPFITIDRNLPSKSTRFLLKREVVFNQIKKTSQIKLHKPIYLKIEKSKNFLIRIKKLLFKSEKEIALNLIFQTQKTIDTQYGSIYDLYNRLLEYQNSLNAKQKEIKRVTLLNVEELIVKYKFKSKEIDVIAENKIEMERREKIIFQKKFIQNSSILEQKIKDSHNNIVKSFELQLITEKDNFSATLYSLNDREKIEIQKLDDHLNTTLELIKRKIQVHEKNFLSRVEGLYKFQLNGIERRKTDLKNRELKLISDALERYQSVFYNNSLNQYVIYNDRYSIFTDSHAKPDRIVSNLNRNGIVTAADIKGIDDSGRILKANGTWVKVPEVAITRAKKLEVWRKKMERQSPAASLPQSLPYSEVIKVKQLLANDLQKIEDDERILIKEILAQKNMPNSEFALVLAQSKENELEITREIQHKKQLVLTEIGRQRNEIQKRINNISKNISKMISAQNDKFELATKNDREELKNLNKKREFEFQRITKEYDPIHKELEEKICILNKNFELEMNSLINHAEIEFKAIEDDNDLKIKQYNTSAKEMANRYNDLVDNLLWQQSSFKHS